MVAIILITLSSFSFAQSADVQTYRDAFSQRVRAATMGSNTDEALSREPGSLNGTTLNSAPFNSAGNADEGQTVIGRAQNSGSTNR